MDFAIRKFMPPSVQNKATAIHLATHQQDYLALESTLRFKQATL